MLILRDNVRYRNVILMIAGKRIKPILNIFNFKYALTIILIFRVIFNMCLRKLEYVSKIYTYL